MSADGQRTKWRRKSSENFNRLSRAHERYRQTDDRQTDGRTTTYSEHELEFTFANKIGLRLSVCACVSVRLRALSWSHFLIDFHKNWHRRKEPPKGRTSLFGLNIAPAFLIFCPPPKKNNLF